jgi:hypothetical protein|tara:strand:- start:6016 stop:6756 length:741 start_codon:yes stop_codon:yes gene_type:complete
MKKEKIDTQWQFGDMVNAGKTSNWYARDSQERFAQLLKRNISKEWKGVDIDYTFNKLGYRCDEFSENTKGCDVLFAGCSQSIGYGLLLEQTYGHIVSTELDIKYHNIGVSGSDWQHIGQRLAYWVPKLKPKVVVLRHPPDNRFNWWDKQTPVSTALWTITQLMDCTVAESRPLIDIIDNTNAKWYHTSILGFIRDLCNRNDVILIDDIKRKQEPNDSFARDCNHNGVNYHKRIAKKLLKQLKEILH